MAIAKKVFKMPKTMGQCADKLYETRERRLAAQKVVDEIQAEESALKEHIIQNLPKSDTGAQGKVARVTVVTSPTPQVKDWDLFWKSFDKKKDTDLLQRRLSNEAVQARWDNGKQVAGVEVFNVVKVSINKVG